MDTEPQLSGGLPFEITSEAIEQARTEISSPDFDLAAVVERIHQSPGLWEIFQEIDNKPAFVTTYRMLEIAAETAGQRLPRFDYGLTAIEPGLKYDDPLLGLSRWNDNMKEQSPAYAEFLQHQALPRHLFGIWMYQLFAERSEEEGIRALFEGS